MRAMILKGDVVRSVLDTRGSQVLVEFLAVKAAINTTGAQEEKIELVFVLPKILDFGTQRRVFGVARTKQPTHAKECDEEQRDGQDAVLNVVHA